MKQLTVPSSLLENGRCTSTRNDIITRWNINIGRSVARAKTSDSAVKYKVRRSNGIPSATFLDAAHAVYRLERYIYIYFTPRETASTHAWCPFIYVCRRTNADTIWTIMRGMRRLRAVDRNHIPLFPRAMDESAFPRFHGGIADEE